MLRALIDFTLSNARRFYSSVGNLLDRKRLRFSAHRAAVMTGIDLTFPAFSLKFVDFAAQFCFCCKFSFHEERHPAAPRVPLFCSYHIVFQPRGESSTSYFTIISPKKNLKVQNREFKAKILWKNSLIRLMPLPSARQHGKMWHRQ